MLKRLFRLKIKFIILDLIRFKINYFQAELKYFILFVVNLVGDLRINSIKSLDFR